MEGVLMRNGTFKSVLTALLLAAIFTAGCPSLPLDPRGRSVPAELWVPIPESGQKDGVYRTEDLTVSYRLFRHLSRLRVSGTIRFADRVAENFPVIEYFTLAVFLLDSEGKVIQVSDLASVNFYRTEYTTPSDFPLTFDTSLTLTPNGVALAFTYTGRAFDDSEPRGGFMDFWEYPLK